MKRDLAEFTSTMQEDSSKMAATVKEKLTVCNILHVATSILCHHLLNIHLLQNK